MNCKKNNKKFIKNYDLDEICKEFSMHIENLVEEVKKLRHEQEVLKKRVEFLDMKRKKIANGKGN